MSKTIVIDKDTNFRHKGGEVPLSETSIHLFEASLASMIDLDGVPLEVIGKATATMANLLAAHWKAIRELASDEDAEGIVKVAFGIALDFSHQLPAGTVAITYSKKFKDEASFTIDDPKQPKLPLEEKAE